MNEPSKASCSKVKFTDSDRTHAANTRVHTTANTCKAKGNFAGSNVNFPSHVMCGVATTTRHTDPTYSLIVAPSAVIVAPGLSFLQTHATSKATTQSEEGLLHPSTYHQGVCHIPSEQKSSGEEAVQFC